MASGWLDGAKTVAGAYPELREALWGLAQGLLTPRDLYSGATRTMDMLFVPKPVVWGLRGDAYLWDAMRETLGGRAFTRAARELVEGRLRRAFRGPGRCRPPASSGQPEAPEHVYVDGFAHGGMSSGQVSLPWWRETGFPLLGRTITEKGVAG